MDDVVGGVGTIVQNELAAPETNGAVHLPYRDSGLTFTRLVVRVEDADPASLAPALPERMTTLDREPVLQVPPS